MKENKRKYNAAYDKANTIGFYIKLNKKTDADIIDELAKTDNKQGLIKSLIRDHINNRELINSLDL